MFFSHNFITFKSPIEIQSNQLVLTSQKKYNAMMAEFNKQFKKKNGVFEQSGHYSAKEKAAEIFNNLTLEQQNALVRAQLRLWFKWKSAKNKDTLFRVNPNGVHSDSVNHLLNGVTTVKQNLNEKKQQALLSALNRFDWQDPIFTDKYFIETAMALFANDKINRFQFETLH